MLRHCLLLVLLFPMVVSTYGQELPKPTPEQRDSIRYTDLKNRFYKHRITKEIYKLFFNDIYNRKKSAEVNTIEANPFLDFEGLEIASVTIKQLNLLGASVYDTTRKSNQFQHFVSNSLHRNTREKTIRKSLLLFREGDRVIPQQLKENERILRLSPVILDARILVTPRADQPELVDVLVLTQDVWSLVPVGSFSGFDNFRVGFNNSNVRGLTHSNAVAVRWRGADTLQQLGFRAIYTIPYIGRTFISGQAGFIWERDLKQQYLRFSKPFLSVETRYAGALEAGLTEIQEYKKDPQDPEHTNSYPVRYRYYDLWLGRAFKLRPRDPENTSRFITAVRFNNYHFTKRPFVSLDSNMIYWHQRALMFSVGYSNRNYKRDLLIYGFGRTEDVPIGNMLVVTGGTDNSEFGNRGYAGLQFSRGGYLPGNGGYLYGLINTGSYLQSGKMYQGVLNTTANYFTPLMRLGLSQIRQFINIRFTKGYHRDPLEYVNLTDEFGIRGVFSDQLIGTKRLNIGTETVLFTPGSLLGFRGAHFVYADFGLVANHNPIWKSKLYQSYGIGIRLRNEHLTFNTIELRVGYYPNIPTLSSPWRYKLLGITPLRLPDFDVSAPEIVPFR